MGVTSKLTFEINIKILATTKLQEIFSLWIVLYFFICPTFSSRFGILDKFKTKIGKQIVAAYLY